MNKKIWFKKIGWLGLSTMACAYLTSLPAYAQTTQPTAEAGPDLGEVIVTAERRSINLQKVALSVTAISGDAIAQRGDSDVAQVLQGVPGVVLQGITDGPSQQSVQGGGGPPNIAIRGLGTPSPNTVGAVAIYEDGVLLQGGGANFYDMSRVEVLRGPQGTLYGRGATAGAVNFITNDPTQQFEGSGRIQYGSYDLIATQGMLNVPLTDVLAVRVAFNQIRHNGYFNNGQSNEDDLSSRVKLLYRPSDNFSLLVGFVDYKSSGTGPGQVLLSSNPNPTDWTTNVAGGTGDPISYRKVYAELQWGLGFANLNYIGGYQTTESTFSTNWNGFDCVMGVNAPCTYLVVTQPMNKTWTHELRLQSTSDSALSWVGGAYYYNNKFQTVFEPSLTPPATGATYVPAFGFAQSASPTSIGLFGEATYALTSATRLTAGLRENQDRVEQTQTFEPGGSGGVATPFSETLRHLDWKARVETDLSANNLLYGTISTGYRPGSFVNGQKTENEKVTAYEIGSKNRSGGMLTLNGALFYYRYSGFQNVESVVVNGAPSSIVVPLPAILYGGELELAAQLGPNDRLALSPAVEEAKFTANAPGYETDGGIIPNTPKFSISGRYEHDFVLPTGDLISWQADAHYQTHALTDFDFSNYPTTNATYLQKAYSIVNSSLTFAPKSGKYSVVVFGKNLRNTLYKLTVYNTNPPSAYVSDPRTFGVMISAKF
ncbi:MAG TPA: TonB-dependent receptor plug domain-containing protein [Steroidobacteraceae bacterium]|nr:TonB-dependent receptor plug domain-containing protein [Steroidobacteraceae bacterium]